MAAADRTVHAELDYTQVVRYDKAGKWYVERVDAAGRPQGRQACTLRQAAVTATALAERGGLVHFGSPGGLRFDAAVRTRQEAAR